MFILENHDNDTGNAMELNDNELGMVERLGEGSEKMKVIKRVSVLLFIIIMIIGVCGCGMDQIGNKKTKKKEVVLNERQKQILEEVGLPTEYEELMPSQKRAIVRIEEMLQYAEDKYGIPFAYSGYILESSLEPEQLYAYPVSGSESDCFVVTKTEEGYEDDYVAVYSTSLYNSYILSKIQKFAPKTVIKVSADITNTTLTEIPNAGSAFDGTTVSSMMVFVDGETCSESEFISFMDECTACLYESELYAAVQYVRMKEGVIKYVGVYNYGNYLSDKYCYAREDVYISAQ